MLTSVYEHAKIYISVNYLYGLFMRQYIVTNALYLALFTEFVESEKVIILI